MKKPDWTLTSALCLGIWVLTSVSGKCFFNGHPDPVQSVSIVNTRALSHSTCDLRSSVVHSRSSAREMDHLRLSTSGQGAQTVNHFYAYRYYNPSPGRWISRDPIAEVTRGGLPPPNSSPNPSQGDSNTYAFVANNAILNVDAWGLFIFCKCAPPPVILLPVTAPICTGLFSGPGFAAFGTTLPVAVIGGCVAKSGAKRICPTCPPAVKACTFTATFTCAQVPGASLGIGSWGSPVVTPTGGLCLP